MIKFFRKIRQNFIAENKFGKYFIYAIGEIFLVVVGILIALQINNWKENQKQDLLETKMLTSIRDGLSFDSAEINKTIQFQDDIIKSQKIASNWIQSNLPFQDTLAMHFLKSSFSTNFIYKNAPYETLKQIGLEIIKEDSLRDHISNIYDLKYEEIFLENRDLFNYKEHYRIMLSEDRFEFLDKGNLYKGFKPLFPSKIKADKTYLFKLNILMGSFYLYNENLRILKSDVNKLIKMIDLELQDRKIGRE